MWSFDSLYHAPVDPRRVTVLVRGVGDIGSAVAHRAFREGYSVVLHDGPRPTTTRRGMAFADAVFDGHAALDDVGAMRAEDLEAVKQALAVHHEIRCACRLGSRFSRRCDLRSSWTRGCGSIPNPRSSADALASRSASARTRGRPPCRCRDRDKLGRTWRSHQGGCFAATRRRASGDRWARPRPLCLRIA